MPLQFQQYQGAKTKRQQQDENFEQFNTGLQTLGAQWRAYKLQQKQQELQDMELEMKRREYQSKFGTGVAENIQPGQVISAPPPTAGPEEQMFGFEASMPSFTEETPEQKYRRLGTEGMRAVAPPQQYGSYVMGPDGQPQFMPLPQGYKPAPGVPMPTPIIDAQGRTVGSTVGKPTVLPQPSAPSAKAEGESAEAAITSDQVVSEMDRILPLNANSRGGFFGKVAQRAESAIDPDKPSEKFNNTADVINSLKSIVAKTLKSTFGGQLSDSERAYLNEVYGAVEGMSRKEREIAINGVKKTVLNASQRAAGKASAVSGNPVTPGGGIPKEGDTFQGGKVLRVRRID